MDGLEEKLNALFSSPESMAQLKQLADSLAGTLGSGGEDRENGAGPLPEGLDPRLMQMITTVLREYQAPSRTGNLVAALRPWLEAERAERLGKALRIARLARAAKVVLPEMGARR